MNKEKCPCYTCLVAGMCPGKEPTKEEWDEISRQVDEDDKNSTDSWYCENDEDILDPELSEIPEIIAQDKCPYYKKWQSSYFSKNNLSKLDSWLGKDMEDIKCP